LAPSWHQVKKILKYCKAESSSIEIMSIAGWNLRTRYRSRINNRSSFSLKVIAGSKKYHYFKIK
jgi:hypothetical protein